jgi:nitroreductase
VSATLGLTPDEVLSTTRAVRKRLDLNRPVEREAIEDCLRLAQQAPTGSNRQHWHFVVVTDPGLRAGLAELYRRTAPLIPTDPDERLAFARQRSPEHPERHLRIMDSAAFLYEHLHEVPVHLVPCVEWPRTDPIATGPGPWASVIQAAWSFMLAARERGLGTVWTSFHLAHERDAAELLGIPYDEVMQAALIPVAHTLGTQFKPGPREPLERLVHWDSWDS